MKKTLILLFFCMTLFNVQVFSQVIDVDAKAVAPGICLGNDIQLNAVPKWDNEITPVTYSWKSDPVTPFFPNDYSSTVWAKPEVTTKFIITVTDTKYNIIKKDSVNVVVHYPPLLKIIIPAQDSSSCINHPVEFFGRAENIKGDPKWSTTGSGQITVDPEYNLHATYTPGTGESGVITVTLSGDPLDYCTAATASISRTLEFVSRPQVSVTPNSATICNSPELPLSLTGTVSTNTTSFEWRVVPDTAGTLSNKLVLNPTFMPNPKFSGMATVFLDAKNKGCIESASVTVTVTKFILPLYPEKNPVICEGDKINLEVIGCNDCTYKWKTNETTSKISVSPEVDTQYWVEVKDKQGCLFRDTFYVTVLESPETQCGTVNYNSKTTTVEPPGLEEYVFIVNDTLRQQGSGNLFYWGPYQDIASEFIYIVTNSDGCTDTGSCPIPPFKCVEAFTPNGDGINDLLLPGRKIVVFDRTGNILYQGFDGWNGRFNNREMPEGTYFYVSFKEDNKEDCKQSVTLLRKSLNN